MFSKLYRFSKLVMYLNSCFIDLGRDIDAYSCPMHFGGIEHQFDLPQEPLLIHWCMRWKQSFLLRWVSVH